MAVQNQTLHINAIKAKINKTTEDNKYQLCEEKEESIDHLIDSNIH